MLFGLTLQHGDHDGHGKFLVLDLDGTLIESAGDVTRAINALLDKKGVGRSLQEQVSPMIGHVDLAESSVRD